MGAVVVDPATLRAMAAAVDRYLDSLESARRGLDSLTVPAGIPSSVRAVVDRALHVARSDLQHALRLLTAMPADLRRRTDAADRANELLALDLGKGAFGVFTGSFSGAVPSRSALAAWAVRDGLSADERSVAKMWEKYHREADIADDTLRRTVPRALRYGAKGAGGLVNVAGAAYGNFTDPSLSTSQKIGRTGASLATNAGVSVLSGAASGAMFGTAAGPPGILIGAGAGLAWSFADSKLGVSEHLGNAAAGVIDSAADAPGAVADTISDGLGKLGL
jgi:hypothetical protein